MTTSGKLGILTALVIGVSQIGVCTFASQSENQQQGTIVRTKGDLNGDGSITLDEATDTLKAALNITKLSDDALWAADVDDNESVTLEDAQVILKSSLCIINMKDVNPATHPIVSETNSPKPTVTTPSPEVTNSQDPSQVSPTPDPNKEIESTPGPGWEKALDEQYRNVDYVKIYKQIIDSYQAQDYISPSPSKKIVVCCDEIPFSEEDISILNSYYMEKNITFIKESKNIDRVREIIYIDFYYYRYPGFMPVYGKISEGTVEVGKYVSTYYKHYYIDDQEWKFDKTKIDGEVIN